MLVLCEYIHTRFIIPFKYSVPLDIVSLPKTENAPPFPWYFDEY